MSIITKSSFFLFDAKIAYTFGQKATYLSHCLCAVEELASMKNQNLSAELTEGIYEQILSSVETLKEDGVIYVYESHLQIYKEIVGNTHSPSTHKIQELLPQMVEKPKSDFSHDVSCFHLHQSLACLDECLALVGLDRAGFQINLSL